jgi:hypothetical protein
MQGRSQALANSRLADLGDKVLYHAQIWTPGKRYPVIESALSRCVVNVHFERCVNAAVDHATSPDRRVQRRAYVDRSDICHADSPCFP